MGRDWYVVRDGETFGPFTFERMLQGAREGEMRGDDRVWCEGMPDWLPAADLPELWQTPNARASPSDDLDREPDSAQAAAGEPSLSPSLNEPSDTEGARPPQPRSGLIARHWRGELKLGQSYWGVGVLLTILLVALSKPFGDALEQLNLPPAPLGAVLLAWFTFLCALVVWQLVGIWRAAGRHIKSTGRRGWAVLARAAVVIGAIRAVADFSNVIGPMSREAFLLAAGWEEDILAYRLRLLHNGTELELSGGMPFGTAEALAKVLNAAPGVRVLHLNSIGGRVSEGYQIYRIVRDRRLMTYTSMDCVSACTIAFLGGTERYLSTTARLGFHSTSFGSIDHKQLPDISADLRRLLADHGAPYWFIDKALSTDASSMWYPSHTELIAAKIVTRVGPLDQFTWSGK